MAAVREPKRGDEQLYCALCEAPAEWSCLNCAREFCDKHLAGHRCDLALERERAHRRQLNG